MRMRYPTIQLLKHYEDEVVSSTLQAYNTFDWRVPIVAEEILRLALYHTGKLEPVSTPPGDVQAYCRGRYDQIPHTLLNAHDLWRRGQYLESNLLVRHLLEVFVQMR